MMMIEITQAKIVRSMKIRDIAAVSPAQAAFHIIKWSGNDLCQVWDDSIPTKPWPDNYKAVSRHVGTYDGAVAVKAHLMKKGVCKI